MRTLASFANLHLGETIVVCGCGQSLNKFTERERFTTIGVNDIGRRFDPDYLVVVNPRDQFSGNRFSYVESSTSKFLFTQLDLGLSRENVVKFSLGTQGGTDWSNPDVLNYTQNSPYVALCLAVHMGAKRIGLIGVDFTNHHFFALTGKHSLSAQLHIIDEQYQRLYEAIKARGVEVLNLSSESLLTAFPKMPISEFGPDLTSKTHELKVPRREEGEMQLSEKRIFFVNYKFLSCGEVFTDGLRHAASSLGLSFAEAYWDDADLPAKVEEFKPHWIFVVHGRRFAERWRHHFGSVKKAVWLLDEPYEVDDTARWSNLFDVVFVNDPNTLECHRNAHYLPVAYDSVVHRDSGDLRKYQAGFIGGHNETRERYLLALQEAGYLSYVVGGPWRSADLRRICLAPNIPAKATAELYRQTKVVVNLFRDTHHFNERRIPAYSMNPRVYEALACGAVVVSETRPEVSEMFPDLPLFSDTTQLRQTVAALLTNEEEYRAVKQACYQKVLAHTYRERLLRVCETLDFPTIKSSVQKIVPKETAMGNGQAWQLSSSSSVAGWEKCGSAAEISADSSVVLRKTSDEGPGTEEGLASRDVYEDVELSFEVNIAPDSCFIAKIHQNSQFDQTTNSYHLFCHPSRTYLARHNRVFRDVNLKRGVWQHIKLKRYGSNIELEIDGTPTVSLLDGMLRRGYCFVGVKRGQASIRNLHINRSSQAASENNGEADEAGVGSKTLPKYKVLYSTRGNDGPVVTIITTVYDRVRHLEECLRSVRLLQYRNFEHIIVSDHPPDDVVERIKSLVATKATGAVTLANLDERFNNWGIAPASVGLHLARGRYVCFLSDDNGYTPDHLDPLVEALNHDSDIAFVYSSCQYAGRLVLRGPIPRPGGIDLGQPLFRREIFNRYLSGGLPFDMMAWDWHMIDAFMRSGLRWRHIDRPSFLFRLEACRKQAQP
jgi:glycosyltransferase involved in cell wall biosynthesis